MEKEPDWKAYEEAGGYFALIEGALFVVPMDRNGLMDACEPTEVEFNEIDPADAEQAREIEAELKEERDRCPYTK
jgi:hypothetical protein